VTIAALAVIASTGNLQFVLATHDVNVQAYINQKEECKTARENYPISDLCIAKFSNTITQSGRSLNMINQSVPTTTLTTATHPTVLILAIYPNPAVAAPPQPISLIIIGRCLGVHI
jgi:hypothetical protein